MRVKNLLLPLWLILLTGCDPVFMLPGGKLSGSTAEIPADWSLLREIDTIQLETRPADPYSVNIWAIGLGQLIYVHAGANHASWVQHMEADPRVRLRVGDQIYDLLAERVTGTDEFAQFADAYEVKYDRRPRNENVAEAYLFRLRAPG